VPKNKLADGSQIEAFTRIEISLGIVLAEVRTSKGEKAIVSYGRGGELGREVTEQCPENEFHFLDERRHFPFWILDGSLGTAAAIDEDSEVWILCSPSIT